MHDFDAIIVGGGVQGTMAALECVRRGRRPLLIEREGLGNGATSASLGIVHGGLRYLQTGDIGRWLQSRAAQLWFRREFPAQTRPLRCIMPLYRGCFRSPTLFRFAFRAQAVARRLSGLGGEPEGAGLIGAGEARQRFDVSPAGLVGAAWWDELVLVDANALVRAVAARVRLGGGVVLEQHSAEHLTIEDGRVSGLVVKEQSNGTFARHRAPVVLICAGAASQALAAKYDRPLPALSARMLAFNLLLDRPMAGPEALALSATPGRGRSLFLRPHAGGTLAGTGYCACPDEASTDPATLRRAARAFFEEVITAAPGLAGAQVTETWSGRLPDDGRPVPSLRSRDMAWNHGRHGGPRGLHTLTATKLTTAHAHARAVLGRVWPGGHAADNRGAALHSGNQLHWRAE